MATALLSTVFYCVLHAAHVLAVLSPGPRPISNPSTKAAPSALNDRHIFTPRSVLATPKSKELFAGVFAAVCTAICIALIIAHKFGFRFSKEGRKEARERKKREQWARRQEAHRLDEMTRQTRVNNIINKWQGQQEANGQAATDRTGEDTLPTYGSAGVHGTVPQYTADQTTGPLSSRVVL